MVILRRRWRFLARAFFGLVSQSRQFFAYDYAVGFDFLEIPDQYGRNRFFRYPEGFGKSGPLATRLSRVEAEEALRGKDLFCNFIQSHATGGGERESLMRALSAYKRIECAGSFLNNQPGGQN